MTRPFILASIQWMGFFIGVGGLMAAATAQYIGII